MQNDFKIKTSEILKYTGKDKKVVIPKGVYQVGFDAFKDNQYMEELVVPCNVRVIGNGAFSGCTKLKSVTFIDGTQHIGQRAFYGCKKLETVNFSKTTETIGLKAFYGCSSIKSIVLPSKVRYVGTEAFRNCISLTSVDIQGSVKDLKSFDIGKACFLGCPNIEQFTSSKILYKSSLNLLDKEVGKKILPTIPPKQIDYLTKRAHINAICDLIDSGKLPEKFKQEWVKYITENSLLLFKLRTSKKLPLLHFYDNHDILTLERCKTLLNYCTESKLYECKTFLLGYEGIHYSGEDLMKNRIDELFGDLPF